MPTMVMIVHNIRMFVVCLFHRMLSPNWMDPAVQHIGSMSFDLVSETVIRLVRLQLALDNTSHPVMLLPATSPIPPL